MGYDVRYEAVCKYTEEGLTQSKDFMNFLKKRQALESDYSKQLTKLCKSYNSTTPKRISKSKSEKSDVRSTTLFQTIHDIIDQTSSLASSHDKIAQVLETNISEPLQKYIKEMEKVRKEFLDEGFKTTKSLQDNYTLLKKAKSEYDDLQKVADDAKEKNISAQNTPSTKEKELEKLSAKAHQASEKALKALDELNEVETLCKSSQELYYGDQLPSLLNKFTEREYEREMFMKSLLQLYCDMENTSLSEISQIVSQMSQKQAEVDVDEDIQNLVDDHVMDDSKGANVSVRSLINPTRAGRLMKQVGENDWRLRYCVFMVEERMLYLFESEDSTKPKGLIDLKLHAIHPVDDTYFEKLYCIQIVSRDYNAKTGSGRIHFFSCESEEDKIGWLKVLRDNDFTKSSEKESISDSYQVIRSLKVEIIEARDLVNNDLIKRSLDTYCVIGMNQLKFAKTVMKTNSNAPFWGESFYFDDLHLCLQTFSCSVMAQNRFQKDDEIGKLQISFDSLSVNTLHEEWYPLVSPNSLENDEGRIVTVKEGDFGAVRIKITLTEEKLLPMSCYSKLLSMLEDPEMKAIRLLSEVSAKDKDEVAKCLLKIQSTQPGGIIHFVRVLTYLEVNSTDDPNIIFRGNSLATKAVDHAMKMIGMTFLHNTLKNLIKTIYKETQSCEVDPTRVEKGDDIKKNWRRLNAFVNSFWETISNAADKYPWELRTIFHNLQCDVMEKFHDEKVKHTSVAGFIFLRFICPSVLDPKLFGMANVHPEGTTGRTLTLIAKTLQNLANLVEFGAKEPYMADMNSFITKNFDAMKSCLERFSTPPTTELPPSETKSINVKRELGHLRELFNKHRQGMNEINQQPEVLAQINELLAELDHYYDSSVTEFDTIKAMISKNNVVIPSMPTHQKSTQQSSFYVTPSTQISGPIFVPLPNSESVFNRTPSFTLARPMVPPKLAPKPISPSTSAPLLPPVSVSVPVPVQPPVEAPPVPERKKKAVSRLFGRSKSSDTIDDVDIPPPKNPPPPPPNKPKADLVRELSLKQKRDNVDVDVDVNN